MIVKDSSGTTVLTLGDTGVVGGYLVTNYEEGDRISDSQDVSGRFVDDDFEMHSRLKGIRLAVDVYIEGSDWADVKAKRDALLAAVEARRWQLVIGSVTWKCRRANSSSPMPAAGIDSTWRHVSLSIPVRLQTGV